MSTTASFDSSDDLAAYRFARDREALLDRVADMPPDDAVAWALRERLFVATAAAVVGYYDSDAVMDWIEAHEGLLSSLPVIVDPLPHLPDVPTLVERLRNPPPVEILLDPPGEHALVEEMVWFEEELIEDGVAWEFWRLFGFGSDLQDELVNARTIANGLLDAPAHRSDAIVQLAMTGNVILDGYPRFVSALADLGGVVAAAERDHRVRLRTRRQQPYDRVPSTMTQCATAIFWSRSLTDRHPSLRAQCEMVVRDAALALLSDDDVVQLGTSAQNEGDAVLIRLLRPPAFDYADLARATHLPLLETPARAAYDERTDPI